MGLLTIITKHPKTLFLCSLVIAAIMYQEQLKSVYKSYKPLNARTVSTQSNLDVRLFTVDELAKYDGVRKGQLYLAVMGSVYDVTKGRQHYEKGASYNYFVGKDGSRALVTGNFKDETADKDHVLDLACEELNAILQWKDTYKQKYTPVGLLIGRYYNKQGHPTAYANAVEQRHAQCRIEKQLAEREDQKYPPCNMEWSAEAGSRVWCSKTSGGISRNWSGVPRQLYSPGVDTPRCICVDDSKDHSQALLKEYPYCASTATSCFVDDHDTGPVRYQLPLPVTDL